MHLSALSALPLAQHGGHGAGTGNGELVMTIFLIGVLVVIWTSLAVVCWIFWRAKKREDEAKLRERIEWSAPSS